MAMAISGRAAALVVPSTAATTPLPSTVSVNQSAARLRMKATMKVATAPHASGGGGGAVLERPPAFDQSQLDMLPVTQEGVDPGRLRDGRRSGSGDSCKVLLVDDVRHTEKHGKAAFTCHAYPKYFLFHPSHRIFRRMHEALNVGKKNN
jgi:hypothetical protein